MHALITRPMEDAKPLAELLEAKGVECVVEPLLEIVPRTDAEIDLDGVQALLFTSANGVRAFAAKSSRRDLKVLTVGDASANAAREAGFSDVAAASGDVDALAALAVDRLDPKAGPLFHGAGSALAGDLQGKLEQTGFELRRAVLYESQTATTFSPETRMNLALGGIDMVLLFSPRTARTFASLWNEAEKPSLGRTAALCLSAAVAREVNDLGWQKIEIAERPDQPAMLALVESEIERRAPADAAKPKPAPETAESKPTEAAKTETDPVPPRPPVTVAPTQARGGFVTGLIAGLIGGAVAAVALVWSAPYWQPMIGQPAGESTADQTAAPSVDLQPLQDKIDSLAAAGADAVSKDAMQAAVGDVAAKLDQQRQDLEQQIAQLKDAVSNAQQSGAAAAPAPDLRPLQDRIAKLESDIATISSETANIESTPQQDFSGQIAALKASNDALSQQLSAARDQIATLESKQETLGGTVAKIAALPPAVTEAQQRNTALVLALSELRGKLAVDQPYEATLKAIGDLAGDNADLNAKLAPALDPLRPLAAAGAPTLAQLQASLPTNATAEAANSQATAQAVGADSGWSERLINRLSEAVTIRPVGGDAEGEGPLARLARGEAKLQAGDLAGAVDELSGLDGKPATVAADWLASAKARLAQDAASAALEQVSTALLASSSSAASSDAQQPSQ